MEEEYEIKHTIFGDIKVKKSKPYEEPDTFDPSLQSQESVVVEEEEEEEQAYDFFSAVGAHFSDDKEGTCMLATPREISISPSNCAVNSTNTASRSRC